MFDYRITIEEYEPTDAELMAWMITHEDEINEAVAEEVAKELESFDPWADDDELDDFIAHIFA